MKRRSFLQACATMLALSSAGLSSTKPKSHEPTTFLLLHGAWHNSSAWSNVIAPLSASRDRVLTMDLPGHGVHALFPPSFFRQDRSALSKERSPLAHLSLEDAADAVLKNLETTDSENIVLVGHSMAGHVISRVAEREPDRIRRLIYLAAFMPVDRPSFVNYLSLPEAQTKSGAEINLGDPNLLGASRIDPRSLEPEYLEKLHQAFYGDVDRATFHAFANSLTPDQPLGYFTDSPKITKARWGRVPRTFILTTRDGALAPALQERFIREADLLTPDNQTRVVRIDSSHSPFASQPEKLAKALLAQKE